jgi:hypothetical protein
VYLPPFHVDWQAAFRVGWCETREKAQLPLETVLKEKDRYKYFKREDVERLIRLRQGKTIDQLLPFE